LPAHACWGGNQAKSWQRCLIPGRHTDTTAPLGREQPKRRSMCSNKAIEKDLPLLGRLRPCQVSRKYGSVNRHAPKEWLRAISIIVPLFWSTSRKPRLNSKHDSFWYCGRELRLGTYFGSRGHIFDGGGYYRTHAAEVSHSGCHTTTGEAEAICSFG